MNSRKYIDKVIDAFAKNIWKDVTYHIFLMLERDEKLMREYKQLIDCGSSKHGLNSRIGRRVREKFNLRNIGRCSALKSKLIKSYERQGKLKETKMACYQVK